MNNADWGGCYRPRWITSSKICIILILGDRGAVSRVGRKGGTKVFKYGRKSAWVPTLTELFPKIQADAGSWLGTNNALYCCAQSANSFFSWVRTRRLLSCHTCPVRSPSLCEQGKLLFSSFLTRSEGTTDESKKRLGCYYPPPRGGGYFRNFWVRVCRWDPGTLNLYQS